MVLDPVHILYVNVHQNLSGLFKKKEKKTQLCNDKQKDRTLTNMMHSLNFRVAVAHITKVNARHW